MSPHGYINALIGQCRHEAPCEADFRFDEPMSAHTSFKTGGPADCWLRPSGGGLPSFCAALLKKAAAENIPVFILGGGANILVADKGIRGIVLDLAGWSGLVADGGAQAEPDVLSFRSGTVMDKAAETAAEAGLSGLEFLAGMPGSVGGGVWMNARCYEREIADALVETEVFFSGEQEPARLQTDRAVFGYKRSPFQERPCLILSAAFRLKPLDQAEIRLKMKEFRKDRERKGHYRYPCAGSIFKNNRDFGKPTGKIVDELGLRGLRIGGAQVAPFHGNIIINTGGASAADIQALILEVSARVKNATGFVLEPEIRFIGDWAMTVDNTPQAFLY